MYLLRRVQRLLSDLRSGKLVLTPEQHAEHADDIAAVKTHEDGDIDLTTVSDKLRSWARSYYLVASFLESEPPEKAGSAPPATTSAETQTIMRELFMHFEEVFCSLTNSKPDLFVRGQDVSTAIQALGRYFQSDPHIAETRFLAAKDATERLLAFYGKTSSYLFRAAKELPGLKMVLGGAQSFVDPSADAVRSMVLYSDTVAIADPIYRFTERELDDGAFLSPSNLEELFHILTFKPLVDAELPFPAVVVFPSWERTFEKRDPQTQDGIARMQMSFFGFYLDAQFDDPSEIFAYGRKHPEKVIDQISASNLLVGFGRSPTDRFSDHIQSIRDYYKFGRSQKIQEATKDAHPAILALLTIVERLTPLYHLNENAAEMAAAPLMSLPVHWHYYELMSKADSGALVKEKVLPKGLLQIGRAFTSSPNNWLGNVPIDALVDMRRRGDNNEFRKKLGGYIEELRSSTPATIAHTYALVERAIQQLITENTREAENIKARYQRIYSTMAVGLWTTLGASFLPFLPAIITATAGVAGLGGYLGAKANEHSERLQLGRTLTGILAASARRS